MNSGVERLDDYLFATGIHLWAYRISEVLWIRIE